jgi:hypothetical protein
VTHGGWIIARGRHPVKRWYTGTSIAEAIAKDVSSEEELMARTVSVQDQRDEG